VRRSMWPNQLLDVAIMDPLFFGRNGILAPTLPRAKGVLSVDQTQAWLARMASKARWAFMILTATATAACSSGDISCGDVGSDLGVFPLLTVTDIRTGKAICDATIVVTSSVQDGDAGGDAIVTLATTDAAPEVDEAGDPVVLQPEPPPPSPCSYDTSGIRADVTLKITRAGYRTVSVSNVYPTIVSNSSCVLPPAEVVAVKLTPVDS